MKVKKVTAFKKIGGWRYTMGKSYDTKAKVKRDVKDIQARGGKAVIAESTIYTIYYR